MQNNIILNVKNISKSFLIPEERADTLKERLIAFFKRESGFRKYDAVNDVSFQLKKGEFLGIIGANGSGKSTLLKIISGIYTPDQGVVNVSGHLVPFLELGVGFNPELTGRENIFLNGIILGMTHQEVKNCFDDIVNFSELHSFLDLKLKNYSSGMQLRLAFAVAIHVDADVYILDEVLSVGDLHFQQKCLKVFEEFRRKGVSVILVSHNLDQIKNMCHRSVWLEGGKVKMYDYTESVIQKYVASV